MINELKGVEFNRVVKRKFTYLVTKIWKDFMVEVEFKIDVK